MVTPTIRDLQQRLTVLEFGQLVTLRDELYRHVLGFQDARFNVALDVVDCTAASLLMHMDEVRIHIENTTSTSVSSRYMYELHRGIASSNARLGSCITIRTCCEWGAYLRAHWKTANHVQPSNAVAGNDTLLSSTLNNMLAQLVNISERLGRLEDSQAQMQSQALGSTQTQQQSPQLPTAVEVVVPASASASTLAGCLLIWYTEAVPSPRGASTSRRRSLQCLEARSLGAGTQAGYSREPASPRLRPKETNSQSFVPSQALAPAAYAAS